MPGRGNNIDDFDDETPADAGPQLMTPAVTALVGLAGARRIKDGATRKTVLEALRQAAAKRVAGVTKEKRRRHDGHAARLVAGCAVIDVTPETAAWVTDLRARYRRFHALQDEFTACMRV